MPRFSVNGSRWLARYPRNSTVIHHKSDTYELHAPLQLSQIKDMSFSTDGEFRVHLADGSIETLRRKSKEEAAQYHAAHRHKLRILRHQTAQDSLEHAKIIQAAAKTLIDAQHAIKTASKELLGMQRRLHAGAEEIAGEYFQYFHDVSFRLEAQPLTDPVIEFANVLRIADSMVSALEPVATAIEPPPLPRESDETSDPYKTDPE